MTARSFKASSRSISARSPALRILKRVFGFVKVRFRGLKKNRDRLCAGEPLHAPQAPDSYVSLVKMT
jgi:hypothetical protein